MMVRLTTFALLLLALSFGAPVALAGQGVSRMLYTTPNFSFIEQRTGETIVSINDASGSIATLQASINSARAANPTNVIVIRLLSGATYSVTTASLQLGSHECLVGSGATIKAAAAAVTVPLIQISSGSSNVSVAGGVLDGSGAAINGIYAPAAARVNIEKVTVQNCGLDCILLKGNGNSTYDNEMTVTRCDVSGSPAHAGISIQNSTQTAVVDNNCHDNAFGIWLSCAWATVANNSCQHNTTGIDVSGGNDNVVANNTCDNNGVGIHAGASNNILASNSMGNNSSAGINSNGSGNTFADNLFTAGNAVNFISGGSGDHVVAYRAPLSAPSQDYFYPPLINDQHTNIIVNGMGRTDVTIASTTIDSVQSQYNSARSANPNNVIVLHLNGTFSVGASPLVVQANTCVLLNGTIQIGASTGASAAILGTNSPAHVSVSGGIIDGGNLTGNNGIYIPSGGTLQLDAITLRDFGLSNPRVGGSDVVRFTGGSTPHIVTRCLVNGGAARGIWLENSSAKAIVSDCESTAVNQDGVDCDASSKGCVVKFNYCHDLVRYGVFLEQSATHNLALGNICNNTGRDINIYNNSTTPRGDTAFNSVVCNSLLGNNGLRNGSTGTNVVQSSHNFLFNNTVINASISSESYGTENYYSQNYQAGGSLSTAGVESFFNSTSVSSNQFVQDNNSGLALQVKNAATTNGAPVTIAASAGLNSEQWALIPTDSGYFQIKNRTSGLVIAVNGASLVAGAPVVQFTFGSAKNDQWMPMSAGNGLYYFSNRLSGLCLDVPGAAAGTQLDQQPYNGASNQQFALTLTQPAPVVPPPFTLSASPGAQTVVAGNGTNFMISLTTNAGFSGPVSFGLSGLPPNAGGSFNPPALSNAASSTLSVVTDTNTPGGNYFLTVTGTNGSGVSNSITISLTVTTPGSDLIWNSGSSTAWDTTANNWFNELTGGSDVFQAGKNVVFTDRASVVTSVTIASGVSVAPGVTFVTADNASYTISGAGKISGTNSLVKSGLATLTLNTANDYTGPTTISGGVLATPLLANGGSASGIGSAASASANLVLDGGTLQWVGNASVSVNRGFTVTPNGGTLDSSPPVSANLTMSGAIAFSGSEDRTFILAGSDPNPLVIGGNVLSSIIADGSSGSTTVQKDGNNAWNLTGVNTYSGGSMVNGGRLRANTSASAFGTGPVTVADGAQAYCNVGATFPNAFFIQGSGIPETEGNYGALRLAANSCVVSNTITLVNGARITARGASAAGATISGQITGDASLEFGNSGGGIGIITLGNGNNNWSGNTIVSHGTVKLGVANAIPHGLDNGDVVLNNSNPTNNSVLDLNGISATINGLSSSGSDPTRCTITNSSAVTATLTVGDNDANGAFAGILRNGVGAVLLTKIGRGTETLGGLNTFTGSTIVSEGTLIVNGSIASASLTVLSGANLGGAGTIGGSVTVNQGATLFPGNSLGELTVNNSITLRGATMIEFGQGCEHE